MQYLDVALASQRLGCAKPDAQIYTKANEMLGAAPHELLFFDDKVENVQAATAQGWNARVCSSVATMIVGLREFGFTL
jgi:putative hydrolase of the HAD superfamily